MTIDEIKELIKIDETRTVELKKTTGELKDGMRSLCAMLNSDGGYVIFGIAPKTLKITGQMVTDNTRQEIAREIRKLEPYVNMAVEYVDVPDAYGQQIIALHADKNLFSDAPYVYDGRPYYKLESTTMLMPQQMYNDMLRKHNAEQYRWDTMVANNMTIEDLDEKRIRTAVSIGVRSGRVNPEAEGEPILDILTRLKLLVGDKPTHAAVMLFAKDTFNYPEMELKMGFFRGKNKMAFVDNKIETGNFFDLLNAGVAFCFRNLRLRGEVKGLIREEKLEIPIEALREGLTNALCHRQYERTNGSVSLAIYDDRVEIANPGKFPPQLNAEKIKQKHESFPYNKLIAKVLYQTKFLEGWGTGANRMVELCREQGIADPEWIVENGIVRVIFWRPSIVTDITDVSLNVSLNVSQSGGVDGKQNCSLNERQRRIKVMISDNNTITVANIAKTINVTPRTIYRDLKQMGIRWEGHSKTGHWTISD